MKKSFKIEVDCPVCACKIEDAAKKVDGVEECSVNYIMQKMIVAAADDKFDAVMKKVVKAAKKIEPEFEIEL